MEGGEKGKGKVGGKEGRVASIGESGSTARDDVCLEHRAMSMEPARGVGLYSLSIFCRKKLATRCQL